jgi:hypothetical protein
LKEGGTEKCIDFVKGKNSNVSLQPTEKAYQYPINRVKDKIEKLNKNRHRPSVALELENYLHSQFTFPKADLSKRGPQVLVDETLNLKSSLLNEKLKTQLITETFIEVENEVKEKYDKWN